MEKVSVIIPVYKVENYLDKCVASIVEQTYTNLEIILVDDGSPDRCPQICNEWARKDSRIRVIHKENGGLSDARNAGLAIASGSYICFVDSDDWVSRDYIEIMHTTLIREGADIAAINFLKVDEQGQPFPRVPDETMAAGMYSGRELLLESFRLNAPRTAFVVSWAKLYRKELFDQLRFPKGKLNEDEFVFFPLYLSAKKVACVEDIGYYYLQRSSSIMGQGLSEKRLQDNYEYWQQRLELTRTDELLHSNTAVNYASWIFLTAIPHLQRSHHLCRLFVGDYRRFMAKYLLRKEIALPLAHKLIYLAAILCPYTLARLKNRLQQGV